MPHLRIVEDCDWERVKARQQTTRSAVDVPLGHRPERARRPQYLFSGMLTCGCCGGGYTLIGKTRCGCASSRNKGTCNNRRTSERKVLEERVLSGLNDCLVHPELIAEFVTEYVREFDRLMKEARGARTTAERDLAQTQKKIDQIVEAVCEGLYHSSMKDKLTALEDTKVSLTTLLQAPEEQPLALLPSMAGVYRKKVAELTSASNVDDAKAEATELLRGHLSGNRLIPEGDGLALESIGELANIMALAESRNDKTRRSAAGSGQVTMVAGAGFQKCLPLTRAE